MYPVRFVFVDESLKMVYTKPLHTEDERLVYFEIIEPPTLRYIYIGRPARNFGSTFVSYNY